MGLLDIIILPSFSFIDVRQRSKVAWLVVLLLCQALLDIVSVVSLAPVALIMLQPETVFSSEFLNGIYQNLHFHDVRSFSLFFLSCLVAFLLIKYFLTNGIGDFRTNVAFSISGQLSRKVIRNFLQLPYMTYFDLKSSHELNRVINLPTVFAHNILLPMATLFTEGCILLLLSVVLIVYRPWAMAFLVIVLLPSALLYRWNQKRVKSINDVIKTKYPQVLEKFLSLFDNLVEVKLYRKEDAFAGKIESANLEVMTAQSDKNKLVFYSSRTIETTAALCLCLLIGYLVFTKAAVENAVVMISLFAAAAVRAIPSFNRIFVALVEMRSSVFVLEELRKYHTEQKKEGAVKISFNNVIELKDIHFAFPGHGPLFQNLSLIIRKGEKVALTGKSGNGKTTLLLVLMRFLKEVSGSVSVDGLRLDENNVASWRSNIAYVPQNAIILDGSIRENISFGGPDGPEQIGNINDLLNSLGLGSWLAGLPNGLDTRLGEKGIKISGGQRQRLAIARALHSNANLLLLDEMTNQLDALSESEVWNTLSNENFKDKTIVMITHHGSLLEQFDTVYELERGNLGRIEIRK